MKCKTLRDPTYLPLWIYMHFILAKAEILEGRPRIICDILSNVSNDIVIYRKVKMTATLLQQLIIERIRREGPLTFAEYMRMALYEPNYGYYVTGQAKMGWEGDYYTSTDVSTFFANCVGRQLLRWWERLGRPAHFIVLEQGAGRGDLARGVRDGATREAPDFYAALDYR